MTHPLLFNPFHSKPDHAQERLQERGSERMQQTPRHAAAWAARTTPVCGHCRSDDITSTAIAQWSNEKQEWELANTFARPAHCNSCNVACEIVWLPLN